MELNELFLYNKLSLYFEYSDETILFLGQGV